jgi:hypothetical protein
LLNLRRLCGQRLHAIDVPRVYTRKFGSHNFELAGAQHVAGVNDPDFNIIDSNRVAQLEGVAVLDLAVLE